MPTTSKLPDLLDINILWALNQETLKMPLQLDEMSGNSVLSGNFSLSGDVGHNRRRAIWTAGWMRQELDFLQFIKLFLNLLRGVKFDIVLLKQRALSTF